MFHLVFHSPKYTILLLGAKFTNVVLKTIFCMVIIKRLLIVFQANGFGVNLG